MGIVQSPKMGNKILLNGFLITDSRRELTPTMTKKDYELIAESVKRTITVESWMEKNQLKKQAKLDALRLIANDLAGSLYGDNARFDRNKFLTSCGVKNEWNIMIRRIFNIKLTS